MGQVEKYLSTSLQKLETIQGEFGQVQFQLYEALANDLPEPTEEGIRKAVGDMEDLQRIVGMIQTAMIKVLLEHKKEVRTTGAAGTAHLPVPLEDARQEPTQAVPASTGGVTRESPTPEESHPSPSPVIESVKVSPPKKGKWNVGEWLKERGLTLVGTRPSTPLGDSADNLALALGDHFDHLEDFYWMLKRQALGGTHNRLGLNGKSEEAKLAIREWGKSLLKDVFLKKFHVNAKSGTIEANIQDHPDIHAFIKGEWLERYACGVVKRQARDGHLPPIEVMTGIQVRDGVKAEAEFDLLARGSNGKVIWIECKSGQWRDYLDRYHWLNLDHLKLGQEQAAMAITEKIDEGQRRNACAISGMTVIQIQDLPAWVRTALQE